MTNFQRLRNLAIPITDRSYFQELLRDIGDKRFVLLGEATHGSTEFYRERAEITKALIETKNFDAVVIEGDWPDSFEINQYVHELSSYRDAQSALLGFDRFPTWMWRNEEIVDFVEWLKNYNTTYRDLNTKVRFYGFDLYSLFKSIDLIQDYLMKRDPNLWEKAKKRFSCFDHCNRDAQLYGYLAKYSYEAPSCEHEVIAQLKEILKFKDYLYSLGNKKSDEFFSIHQNVRLVQNAENYYRQMYAGGLSSWNLRDTHMAETISEIDQYLSQQLQRPAKIIVWAHNSHIGDALATQMGEREELNVGQLMRDQYPEQTYLLGFTTYDGFVTAASEWGGVAERKRVNPALPDSYEALFHEMGLEQFLLLFRGQEELTRLLPSYSLERAIGVIYLPQSERMSHYFQANILRQFDAVIHIDRTSAVKPLEKTGLYELDDAAETYPSGL